MIQSQVWGHKAMTLMFHAKIIQFCFVKCLATILFGKGKESILMTIEERVVLSGLGADSEVSGGGRGGLDTGV